MSSILQQFPHTLKSKITSGLLMLLGFSIGVALVLIASAMLSYNAVSARTGA